MIEFAWVKIKKKVESGTFDDRLISTKCGEIDEAMIIVVGRKKGDSLSFFLRDQRGQEIRVTSGFHFFW